MNATALLTVKEVAEKLGCTSYRVYRRIQRGDLKATPAAQGNARYLVSPDELQRYIDAGGLGNLSPSRWGNDGRWITTGEAARRTGMTMETIRQMCLSGRLQFERGATPGSRLFVSARSIDELLG